MNIKEQVANTIAAALTDTPTPAKAIWRKLDCWAPNTVKHQLDLLVAAGRAVRTQDSPRSWTPKRHLYSRPVA